jgi:hypothetical protein
MKANVQVVGVIFRPGYPDTILELPDDAQLRLVRETGNPHDLNAIGVYAQYDGKDIHLGYIPALMALRMAPAMDAGTEFPVVKFFKRINPDHPQQPGLKIVIDFPQSYVDQISAIPAPPRASAS